jgi:hypothetical protein
MTFYLLTNYVNVAAKSNKQKKCGKKNKFLVVILEFTGSESGSVSQRYGSADPDPDPYQNVTDP